MEKSKVKLTVIQAAIDTFNNTIAPCGRAGGGGVKMQEVKKISSPVLRRRLRGILERTRGGKKSEELIAARAPIINFLREYRGKMIPEARRDFGISLERELAGIAGVKPGAQAVAPWNL